MRSEMTRGCVLWSLLGGAAGQGCVHNGVDFSPLNTVRTPLSAVAARERARVW